MCSGLEGFMAVYTDLLGCCGSQDGLGDLHRFYGGHCGALYR